MCSGCDDLLENFTRKKSLPKFQLHKPQKTFLEKGKTGFCINQCCISTFPIFWGRFFRDAIYKRQNSAQNLCVVFLVLWSNFPPTYVGGDFWCVVLKLSWLWIHRKRKSSIKTRTAKRGENFFSILPLFNGKGHMQSGVQHFNITALPKFELDKTLLIK